jgi:hypothetical protein
MIEPQFKIGDMVKINSKLLRRWEQEVGEGLPPVRRMEGIIHSIRPHTKGNARFGYMVNCGVNTNGSIMIGGFDEHELTLIKRIT